MPTFGPPLRARWDRRDARCHCGMGGCPGIVGEGLLVQHAEDERLIEPVLILRAGMVENRALGGWQLSRYAAHRATAARPIRYHRGYRPGVWEPQTIVASMQLLMMVRRLPSGEWRWSARDPQKSGYALESRQRWVRTPARVRCPEPACARWNLVVEPARTDTWPMTYTNIL